MTEIVLVRQNSEPIAEADAEAARRVLFGQVDGLSEQHRKSWRRLWSWFLKKAEPGEMVEIKTHRERLGWYHRKHMALEQAVFDAQEKFDSFEQFRNWLKIGAGWCDWIPGPKGAVVPVPKSISYASTEQDEMERVHAAMMAFLRTEHPQKVLWRHLDPAKRAEMMDVLLQGHE
jgi:hypothetical protein